ncbi:MAG: hypothetical protein K8R36_21285 [Planctomycetales bacterium]|nr:hypothetical protein [Planctomycetales bacterium]
MSLFADSRYQWRETYFVLFDREHRPLAADVQKSLSEIGKLELQEVQGDADGLLDSLTILSHADAAGMDITFVTGEEVKEQIVELKKEWKGQKFAPDELTKVQRALAANARFDIYHFEEIGDSFMDNEEDEILDPATLLLVLARLARLCHGVGVDPQAGAVL